MNDLTNLAKVVAVGPDVIEIEISSTQEYNNLEVKPQIGSYIQVSDGDGSDVKVIAVVRSFRVKDSLSSEDGTRVTTPQFILSLQPVGRMERGEFKRGGQQISIPPKLVELASGGILESIYGSPSGNSSLSFGTLALDPGVKVNLNGDRFFGKHIGVVGSTGSGKSSTVAAILQEGIRQSDEQRGRGVLNNSHIIIVDLHGEYANAFPTSRVLGVEDLRLPYWLMNAEELEEMFIESNEHNSHNQVSQFRDAVIENKRRHNPGVSVEKVTYDAPYYFSLDEVINYLHNLNLEMIGKEPGEGLPKLEDGTLVEDRAEYDFSKKHSFAPQSQSKGSKTNSGPFLGEFNRFLMRLEARKNDKRLDFLLSPRADDGSELKSNDFRDILEEFLGYKGKGVNVTILDLSGVPFEVLSVVVALVTRLVFTFSFHYKKLHRDADK